MFNMTMLEHIWNNNVTTSDWDNISSQFWDAYWIPRSQPCNLLPKLSQQSNAAWVLANSKGDENAYASSFKIVSMYIIRALYTTAIFNCNRNFQRQPRSNFPCMGSSNRNHNRNLQVAVAVAVDQNFVIFGGRSLKSRLRLGWCMGRNDQICHISTDISMLLNQCIDTNEIFPVKHEVKKFTMEFGY